MKSPGEGQLGWLVSVPQTGNAGAGPMVARSFDEATGKLCIDFSRSSRPALLTQLLRDCLSSENGTEIAEDDLWAWTVPRRTQALLAIVAATRGVDCHATWRCSTTECGQLLDLELNLEQFRQDGAEGPIALSPVAGVEFEMRMPTGDDQRRFGNSLASDPLPFVRHLITRGDAASFRREWLPLAEAALEQHDELTSLRLIAMCPWCGQQNELEFDLERFLLRELERRQTDLLDGVHRIARAYHWSEQEILALPPHRREYYLDRIDREERP